MKKDFYQLFSNVNSPLAHFSANGKRGLEEYMKIRFTQSFVLLFSGFGLVAALFLGAGSAYAVSPKGTAVAAVALDPCKKIQITLDFSKNTGRTGYKNVAVKIDEGKASSEKAVSEIGKFAKEMENFFRKVFVAIIDEKATEKKGVEGGGSLENQKMEKTGTDAAKEAKEKDRTADNNDDGNEVRESGQVEVADSGNNDHSIEDTAFSAGKVAAEDEDNKSAGSAEKDSATKVVTEFISPIKGLESSILNGKKKEKNKPFLLPVEDLFSIAGRGTTKLVVAKTETETETDVVEADCESLYALLDGWDAKNGDFSVPIAVDKPEERAVTLPKAEETTVATTDRGSTQATADVIIVNDRGETAPSEEEIAAAVRRRLEEEKVQIGDQPIVADTAKVFFSNDVVATREFGTDGFLATNTDVNVASNTGSEGFVSNDSAIDLFCAQHPKAFGCESYDGDGYQVVLTEPEIPFAPPVAPYYNAASASASGSDGSTSSFFNNDNGYSDGLPYTNEEAIFIANKRGIRRFSNGGGSVPISAQ